MDCPNDGRDCLSVLFAASLRRNLSAGFDTFLCHRHHCHAAFRAQEKVQVAFATEANPTEIYSIEKEVQESLSMNLGLTSTVQP